MLLLATENISNKKDRRWKEKGKKDGPALHAAFNKTIWCTAGAKHPHHHHQPRCHIYAALSCQTGFYYGRKTGREHLREEEQLQYYLGFSYFLPPCVCLCKQLYVEGCATCFSLIHLDRKQHTSHRTGAQAATGTLGGQVIFSVVFFYSCILCFTPWGADLFFLAALGVMCRTDSSMDNNRLMRQIKVTFFFFFTCYEL